MPEKRLFVENGVAARIAVIIEPVINELGFRLVRIRITGERGCTVQIMAERPDGSLAIKDCELISQSISPVLELEDPIDKAYHLEISSPGMDRPLVRQSDFIQWVGHEAKIEMTVPFQGRRKFRGILGNLEDNKLLLHVSDAKDEGERDMVLPLVDMSEAHLVLNDDLVREALRRGTVPQPEEDDDIEFKVEQEKDINPSAKSTKTTH